MLTAIMAIVAAAGAMPQAEGGLWRAATGGGGCALSRDKPADGASPSFLFVTLPAEKTVTLLVSAPDRARFLQSGKVTIGLPGGRRDRSEFLRQGRWFRISLPRALFDELPETAVATISIDGAMKGLPSLSIKGADWSAVQPLMKTCEDGLLRQWGFDPATLRRAVVRPEMIGDPASWIAMDDFPGGLLGKEGSVVFIYDVSADGRVTACKTVLSRGPEGLGPATCKAILKRGRFRPARDGNGKVTNTIVLGRLGLLPPPW